MAEQTVLQWLEGLAESSESSERDSQMMENILHRVGWPAARVVIGVVYLDGHGTLENRPMSIHSVAKMLLMAKDKKNPGMAWHKAKMVEEQEEQKTARFPMDARLHQGAAGAHGDSFAAARDMKMPNPKKTHYVTQCHLCKFQSKDDYGMGHHYANVHHLEGQELITAMRKKAKSAYYTGSRCHPILPTMYKNPTGLHCPRCGYLMTKTDKAHIAHGYQCPMCGRQWEKGPDKDLPGLFYKEIPIDRERMNKLGFPDTADWGRNPAPGSINGYIGFYKGKQYEVRASSSYEAQTIIAREHNIRAAHNITVVLAEKDGEQVTHLPLMNPRGNERGNWPPLNVKAIVANVNLVLRTNNIEKLNGTAYRHIINHMGFIAHYSLAGFKSSYSNVAKFAQALRTSEYSDDLDYNRRHAETYGAIHSHDYGPAYAVSVGEASLGILAAVDKYFPRQGRMMNPYSYVKESDGRLHGRRICDVCGKRVTRGYMIGGGEEYYHSGCLNKKYSGKQFSKMFNQSERSGQMDTMWTTWQNPMMLLTAADRKKLPPLYSQEKVADPLVRVKFFNPNGAQTWGAIEFDGKDTFFGWVTLGDVGDPELGYFSLGELSAFRGRFGLGIERDRYFDPMPLSEFKRQYS